MAAASNTVFSTVWDTVRDWGLSLSSPLSGLTAARPTLFSPPWVYPLAAVSNAVLRALWLHKMSPHLRSDPVVLSLTATMECLRRWQWLYFRLEHELIRTGHLVLDGHDTRFLTHPHSTPSLRGLGVAKGGTADDWAGSRGAGHVFLRLAGGPRAEKKREGEKEERGGWDETETGEP